MVNYKGRLDHTFMALADPTRRAILAQLERIDGASIGELAKPFTMQLPAVMKHLDVLANAGLIARSKSGRTVTVRLRAQPMRDAMEWLRRYERFWSSSLDRLASYAESKEAEAQSALRLDGIPTGRYATGVGPQSIEPSPSGGARSKLLDAAISIIRGKGYAATSVDELCARAGVTKGAFFHHFPTKDSLAVAAANYWSEMSNSLFAAAPYHRFDDPLDRVLGYVDFRKSMLRGDVAEFTCLAGTMLQEAYRTHPDIRVACDESIGGAAAAVQSDIAEAMKRYHVRGPWTAESLALHTQAVLQGAFILAKAKGNAAVAEASVDHLRRYVELLFRRPTKRQPGNVREK